MNLGSSLEYNDNIFLAQSKDEGKTSDFITFLGPSADLAYNSRSFDALMTGSYEKRNYMHHSEENDGVASYDFGFQVRPIKDFLYIDAGTTQARVTLDSRGRQAFNNLLNNQTERTGLFLAPYFSRQITPTLAATGGWTYSDVTFDTTGGGGSGGTGEDEKDYNTFFQVSKQLTGKLEMSLRYNKLKHDATINEDFRRNSFSVSSIFNATPRLSFDGEIGRHYFRYEGVPVTSRGFGNASVYYELAKNKTITISYSLEASTDSGFQTIFQEPLITPPPVEPQGPVAPEIEEFGQFDAGSFTSRNVSISFTRTGIVNTSINATATNSDYSGGNSVTSQDREDRVRSISIRFARPIFGRSDTYIRGRMQRQKNVGGDVAGLQKDYRYDIECGFNYNLTEKISGNFSYNYNTAHPLGEGEGYVNNVFWIGLGVALPNVQRFFPF